MIKKFSVYFASIAAIIVFAEGLFVQLSFQALVLRTVLVFVGFFVLGNLLGVITIEALLEDQIKKVEQKRPKKKKPAIEVPPPAKLAKEKGPA